MALCLGDEEDDLLFKVLVSSSGTVEGLLLVPLLFLDACVNCPLFTHFVVRFRDVFCLMGAGKSVVHKGNTSLGQINPAFVSKTILFCLVAIDAWVWGRGLRGASVCLCVPL